MTTILNKMDDKLQEVKVSADFNVDSCFVSWISADWIIEAISCAGLFQGNLPLLFVLLDKNL